MMYDRLREEIFMFSECTFDLLHLILPFLYLKKLPEGFRPTFPVP